ncbi:dienelactone hydrolase family protein, partial [Roseovarius pacificus]|uniref:dienelactone hydrolase family protein n=1 Tax=Roseovarius pacificus TaxID=337701 RepID=UPI002A18C6D8
SAGFIGDPMHHTGLNFVREGYVVLCPDALGFEDRRSRDLPGGDYERYLFCKYLSEGKSLAWKNILDCRRALDYLCSRSEVDTGRIGCYGHSLGSTFSWLVGPWEPRLRCIAGNCCMPSYKAIFGAPLNHSFSNYIPSLGLFGDVPDWVSLIAPTPLHLNFGAADGLNPIDAVRAELPLIADSYAARDAADKFSWFIDEGAGHALTDAMLTRVLDFFCLHLGGPEKKIRESV